MRARSFTLFALLSLIGLVLSVVGASSSSFDVHHLLQFSSASTNFGSHKAAVNMPASTLNSTGSLAGTMLVIPVEQISLEQLKQVLSDQKPGSILFLIPSEDEMSFSFDFLSTWRKIEKFLVSEVDVSLPVWFAVNTPEIHSLYEQLVKESTGVLPSSDQTTLVVESKEASALKSFDLTNVQGLLTGLGPSSDHDQLSDVTKIPTIAITAYWDSFGVVPGVSTGANNDASGVVSLFHLARILSKLYSHSSTQARYNIVFILSSGSSLNFAGTRHWLDSSATGSAIRDSLDFVICLDGIGLDSDLFLHVSRPSKDPKAAKLYQTFSESAAKMQVPLQVIQKKINIADTKVAWEHEIFARRKILAVTLSQQEKSPLNESTASPLHHTSSILDSKKSINYQSLQKNIQIVADVITKLIYQDKIDQSNSIVSGSLLPLESLSKGWIDTLTSSPRMIPFIKTNNPIVDYLETTLKQYVSDVSKQTFKPENDLIFYEELSGKLASYQVKSIYFDLVLLPIVLALNAMLYMAIKGFGPAIADFITLAKFALRGFKSQQKQANTTKKKQ